MSSDRVKREPPMRVLSRRPLPEVARRLRVAFPEVWTRYRLLESTRDLTEVRSDATSGRARPARSS